DSAHHGVLPDQIVEGRGPVLAREHAVGGIARGLIVEDKARLGPIRAVAHNAIRCAAPTRIPTSVPIPKFAPSCGTLFCELRNQRDTSNFINLVRFLDLKFLNEALAT